MVIDTLVVSIPQPLRDNSVMAGLGLLSLGDSGQLVTSAQLACVKDTLSSGRNL